MLRSKRGKFCNICSVKKLINTEKKKISENQNSLFVIDEECS